MIQEWNNIEYYIFFCYFNDVIYVGLIVNRWIYIDLVFFVWCIFNVLCLFIFDFDIYINIW